MPVIVKSLKQREWEIANGLAEFLPPNIEWMEGAGGHPFLYERTFRGYFKGRLAHLNGESTVYITNAEARGLVLEALLKYEQKHENTFNVIMDF